MGCGIFPQEKPSPQILQDPQRQNKKSQKIDCRKRSSQALDIIRQQITVTNSKLNEDDIKFACKHLKQHSLFCSLDDKELKQVANSMQLATSQKDTYIFKEGDNGACFFLIKSGEVQVQIENKYIKTLGPGQCFGEIALIYCTKRTAAIKCKTETIDLIFLKAKQFKQVMRGIRDKNNTRTKQLIQSVQIFSLLTTKQRYTLLNSLVREQFKSGTVLFQKNDTPVSFYIIQSGKVSLVFDDPTKKDIIVGSKQSFGQSAFKFNAKRQGTATVVEDLTCLTINQTKMKQCLGGTLVNIVYHNIKKWALKSSPLFHNFDNRELDQIALQFTTKYAKSKSLIMDMEKQVDALVISIEGKINSKPIGTLFNDQYYENKGFLTQDLIKTQNGVYSYLSFTKLKQTLDNINNKGNIAVAKRRHTSILKQNNQMLNMNSLDYLVKLGQGQFGEVHLVKDRKTGNLFALKCLQKQKIKKQAMQQSAVSQRQILSSICHPLIVGYYASYQDKKNIYFLLQYIYGIEMFEAIREIGILNKNMTRFYLGSITLAIQYLHSKNIIYRDIKPQNSIVNYQGKVFLIDLGTAKILKSQNGYRTDTIIGTPHYMAPQVMQGKGYTLEADYWSLGVLFYQLICGKLPFAEKVNNPYKVYEEVMRTPVTFPDFIKDQTATVLVKKLLNKNIQQRGIGGLENVKNSSYFQGFSWQELYDGSITPPFVPKKFRGSGSNSSKYREMQGYPLLEFLQPKKPKQKDRKVSQQFTLWTNNQIY